MLIYHFGSREGLLAAAVGAVERSEQDALAGFLAAHPDDPYAAGAALWTRVADAATTFAPLFFELSGHAMQQATRPRVARVTRRRVVRGTGPRLRGIRSAAGEP